MGGEDTKIDSIRRSLLEIETKFPSEMISMVEQAYLQDVEIYGEEQAKALWESPGKYVWK